MKHTDFFLKTQLPISAKIQAVKLTAEDWVHWKLDYYNCLKMCRPDFETRGRKNDGIVSELSQESFSD